MIDYAKPISWTTHPSDREDYCDVIPVYAIIPESDRPSTHEPTRDTVFIEEPGARSGLAFVVARGSSRRASLDGHTATCARRGTS